MKALLYTVAINKNGNLIKAIDAEKGTNFYCPVCKSEVVLKKSGKSGKGTKRPHFAHRSLSPNCSPESALHYSFKYLLAEKLWNHINTHTPLNIYWKCNFCSDIHSGNLLKKIKSIEVEHNMKVCKPDIALINADNKVIAVIEIVVKHKPEEAILKFYDENNIILIQINLRSDEDIEMLEYKISNPEIVSTCFNPKCLKCGHFQEKTKMTIFESTCKFCGSLFKIAIVEGGMLRDSSYVGPNKFTKSELEFARNKGVTIDQRYSSNLNRKCLFNVCSNSKCSNFIENFNLFKDYIAAILHNKLLSLTFDIGFHCEECAKIKYTRN